MVAVAESVRGAGVDGGSGKVKVEAVTVPVEGVGVIGGGGAVGVETVAGRMAAEAAAVAAWGTGARAF